MNLFEFFQDPVQRPVKKTLSESLYDNLLTDPILLEGNDANNGISDMEHDDIQRSVGNTLFDEDVRMTSWEWSDPPNPMACPVGPPADDSIEYEDGENPLYAIPFEEDVAANSNHAHDTPNAMEWIPPDEEGPMQRESVWGKLRELPQHTSVDDLVGQIRKAAAEAGEVVVKFDDDRKKSAFAKALQAKGLVPKQDFYFDVDGINAKAKALIRVDPQSVAQEIEKLHGGIDQDVDQNTPPSKPGFYRSGGK